MCLLMRINYNHYVDNPLHDATLTRVPSLRASLCMYGYGYYRETLSLTFHHRLRTVSVTSLSTCGVTAEWFSLNSSAKIVFPLGRHFLQVIRKLHVDRPLKWVQQHILVRIILREGTASIGGAKISIWAIFTKYVPVFCLTTSVYRLYEDEPVLCHQARNKKKTVIATRSANITKNITGSDFRAVMNNQSHFQCIWNVKLKLKYGSFLTLVESLHSRNGQMKILGITHPDDKPFLIVSSE